MNPFMKFIDHGRKFKCNLCQFDSIVPDEYFCNLDATGKRCDISSRPELHLGTIDMTVTQVTDVFDFLGLLQSNAIKTQDTISH